MTLLECLNKLARGKLSNLAICERGTIKPPEIPKVVDAINESLERIYSALPIKEKSVLVEVCESRTEYPLTSEHSLRNCKGDIYDSYDYYIKDCDALPFLDDVMTITQVWDDEGNQRALNDPQDPWSIYTPEPATIAFNYAPFPGVLNVVYRAQHKLLTPSNLTDKLDLPNHLIGALVSYSAYLIHSNINSEIAVQNAQKYFSEYQAIINSAINNGTLNTDSVDNGSKFQKRGWI